MGRGGRGGERWEWGRMGKNGRLLVECWFPYCRGIGVKIHGLKKEDRDVFLERVLLLYRAWCIAKLSGWTLS